MRFPALTKILSFFWLMIEMYIYKRSVFINMFSVLHPLLCLSSKLAGLKVVIWSNIWDIYLRYQSSGKYFASNICLHFLDCLSFIESVFVTDQDYFEWPFLFVGFLNYLWHCLPNWVWSECACIGLPCLQSCNGAFFSDPSEPYKLTMSKLILGLTILSRAKGRCKEDPFLISGTDRLLKFLPAINRNVYGQTVGNGVHARPIWLLSLYFLAYAIWRLSAPRAFEEIKPNFNTISL